MGTDLSLEHGRLMVDKHGRTLMMWYGSTTDDITGRTVSNTMWSLSNAWRVQGHVRCRGPQITSRAFANLLMGASIEDLTVVCNQYGRNVGISAFGGALDGDIHFLLAIYCKFSSPLQNHGRT